ncbi:unnamed protein product, partial [Darwinula stevensoni]
MKTDGFEADKNDIKVISNGITTNLTARWDESVNSFIWAADGWTAISIDTVLLLQMESPPDGQSRVHRSSTKQA